MRLTILIIVVFFAVVQEVLAQVVTLDPTFPKQTDTVTITYDATLGNGALEGQSTVYAHMGVITSESNSPSDWKYVVGEWGTDDSDVLMTSIGNNKFIKTYDIADFHGIPAGEIVLQLAFVFRNADGSVVGRSDNGGDIFVDLFQGSYAAAIINPTQDYLVVENGDTIYMKSSASAMSEIKVFVDGNLFDSISNAQDLNTEIPVDDFGAGKYWVSMESNSGTEILKDSFYFVYPGTPFEQDPPAGIDEGINYIGDSSVTLNLYAPFKDYVFVLGDFSDWELDTQYLMNKSEDGDHFWISLNGLDPNKEYRFQYQVEEQLRIADIYSEKILDPWNDPEVINEGVYPNLTPYPSGQTNDPVSVFYINKPEYSWDTTINYQKPEKEKLIIYETLLRDFLDDHSYKGLKDTLDYLQKLGVNAIQLMPINEFEGNDSWGYNPSFYFAPDKYYGPDYELKALVEECHRRDMAVILDIALNHSFGQNPQVRMYFDPAAGSFGQPTGENPWFNPIAKHDFNVGYDYNHESLKTQEFVDKVLAYWVNEYQIDGYRMDLSKGFTQVNSLGDVGFWGQRDASRIAIWERIRDELLQVDSSTYIILEHFADNTEEQELSAKGFMLWGNCNHVYNEATMGFSGNLSCINYQDRSWTSPHLVGYMESHDEERLMYKNLNFSRFNDDYTIRELDTALKRVELAANFFLTLPGPKMIWQFGELGFDYSINRCVDGTISNDCRLSRKPIVWDYYENEKRKRLFNVFSELNRLRKEYNVFHTSDYSIDANSAMKKIILNGAEMDVVVLGNFSIEDEEITPKFTQTGTWYEFYTQDSIIVEDVDEPLLMARGEYRLYSTQKINGIFNDEPPKIQPPEVPVELPDFIVYPNPFSDETSIQFNNDTEREVDVEILDLLGKKIRDIRVSKRGKQEVIWDGTNSIKQRVPNGQYIVRVVKFNNVQEFKILLIDE